MTLPNKYDLKLISHSVIVSFKRCNIYKSRFDIPLIFIKSIDVVGVGVKSLTYSNANLHAFHILLQNCL